MVTMGFMVLIVGALLFFGAKIAFIRTEKQMIRNGTYEEGESSEEEFLSLVGKGVLLVRLTGIVLVLVGGILIMIGKI